MITIELPIYWTWHYKTKKDKTILVGMNWFRNASHHPQNKVKKGFHELVIDQLDDTVIDGPFELDIQLFYKNPNCDGANIIALMEKFALDAFQEKGTIANDTVKDHLGTKWVIAGQDKENPRCLISIKKI